MSIYVKLLNDILSNKRKWEDHETVMLTEEFSAILQRKLPLKFKDSEIFTIPCTIGKYYFDKVLCHLGACINLIPFFVFRKLGLGEVKLTTVHLQLAYWSIEYPWGLIKDVFIKVDKFIFLVDFIVLDMEEDEKMPLILGRLFLAIEKTHINAHEGKLILRVGMEKLILMFIK